MYSEDLSCIAWVPLKAYGCWVSVDENGELVMCPDWDGLPLTDDAEVVLDATPDFLAAVNEVLLTDFQPRRP